MVSPEPPAAPAVGSELGFAVLVTGGRGLLALREHALSPLAMLRDLALEVPDLRLPVDLAGGAGPLHRVVGAGRRVRRGGGRQPGPAAGRAGRWRSGRGRVGAAARDPLVAGPRCPGPGAVRALRRARLASTRRGSRAPRVDRD